MQHQTMCTNSFWNEFAGRVLVPIAAFVPFVIFVIFVPLKKRSP